MSLPPLSPQDPPSGHSSERGVLRDRDGGGTGQRGLWGGVPREMARERGCREGREMDV